MLGTKYKFYLAFENSNCDEYVTEKTTYAMQFGMVPIVYGGRAKIDHQRIFPDAGLYAFQRFLNLFSWLSAKAVINIRDYESVEKLANYIKYLSFRHACTNGKDLFQNKNKQKKTLRPNWKRVYEPKSQRVHI
jgi:hypothetical protein